jgi:cytochrome P450
MDTSSVASPTTIILSCLGAPFIYFLVSCLYNITLPPLARFPGPKLAAATRWYEYYYQIYRGGEFSSRIYELHQRYGPIVRLNPFEVHIIDRNFYDTLYEFNSELDKRTYNTVNLQNSPTFEEHKMRRRAFDPYFGRAAISKLEPMIQDEVNTLSARLRDGRGTSEPIEISLLYRCLTTDIIYDYAIVEPLKLLERDYQAQKAFVDGFVGQFKTLFAKWEVKPLALFREYRGVLAAKLAAAKVDLVHLAMWQRDLFASLQLQRLEDGKQKTSNDALQRPTIFEGYMKDEKLPHAEKTGDLLKQSAIVLVAAGMETTGFALSAATYHILANPPIYRRVRAEIAAKWPEDASLPSWNELEPLPYLTACLKETLRMSVGVIGRLHRVNHHKSMQYKQWTIPPGTSVGMSQRFILYDPEIFPEPNEFRPDRWLQAKDSKQLDRWLVSFSRGARGCSGQQ